jgi:hypothetical protein
VVGLSLVLKNVTSIATRPPGVVVAGTTRVDRETGGTTSVVGMGPGIFCAHVFDFAAVNNESV